MSRSGTSIEADFVLRVLGGSAAGLENLSLTLWEQIPPKDRRRRLVRRVAFYGIWSGVADRGIKREGGNLGAWSLNRRLREISAKIPEPYKRCTVCARRMDSSCVTGSLLSSELEAGFQPRFSAASIAKNE